MRFAYNSGQRPLPGFTLKRGIGRGGFGEVYFALSDGGKEVALKLLNDNQEVELRGVAQCLNLKHPNLVGLYDLARDPEGNHWVVMEHVGGETLNVVLTRHPNGLPVELAREWFLMLAKAINYLHDHGIVHRDLKPANIFLENGLVKVGDYGLSKAINNSNETRQTQSVGTVHYMAPEISTGNYKKGIDIYAAGVILFEMLTGKVPFRGESHGEILLKHLTTSPNLDRIPSEFVPILAKALAKNPDNRYKSVAEMARAVEATGQRRESPEPAQQPRAIPIPARPLPAEQPPPTVSIPPYYPTPPELPLDVIPAYNLRDQVGQLCGSLILSVLFAIIGIPLWATLTGVKELGPLGSVFFLTVAACWLVLIPARFWTDRKGDPWSRRLTLTVLGGGLGVAALWLDGWLPREAVAEAKHISFYALAFFVPRWWRLADRKRPQRVGVAPSLLVGIWSLGLMLVLNPTSWRDVGALVLASVIVQLVSPWEQPPPAKAKPMRLRLA